MTQSVKKVLLYIKTKFEDGDYTNNLLSQTCVIFVASNQMLEHITQLVRLEGEVVITNRIASRSNADISMNLKREAKLNLRTYNRTNIGTNVKKLKSIIKSSNTTTRIVKDAIRKSKSISVRTQENHNLPRPTNGQYYNLRESFSVI